MALIDIRRRELWEYRVPAVSVCVDMIDDVDIARLGLRLVPFVL